MYGVKNEDAVIYNPGSEFFNTIDHLQSSMEIVLIKGPGFSFAEMICPGALYFGGNSKKWFIK